MAKLTAQQIAAKWQAKFAASGDAYKNGVTMTQKDPIQLAIQAAPRWAQGCAEAAANGQYERGLSRTNKQQWQDACVQKGVPALAAAARVGAQNVEKAEREIGPLRDAIVAGLPARGTLEQNKQRALAMIDGMAALRKRR
jgi:hypothetical protein